MRYPVTALIALALGACGSRNGAPPPPAPIKDFPADMLPGQGIAVFPLSNVRVDSLLGEREFAERRQAMDRVDSMMVDVLAARYPNSRWISPGALKKASAQAPGLLADPYAIPVGTLYQPFGRIPAATLAQMRSLGAAANADRYAVVMANLWFVRNGESVRAYMVVALCDMRLGAVAWSGTVNGLGSDVWGATGAAMRTLVQTTREQ